jgi:hypothetical protein
LKLSRPFAPRGLFSCLLNYFIHLTSLLGSGDLGNECLEPALEINLVSNAEKQE